LQVANSLIARGTDDFFQGTKKNKFDRAVTSWVTYNNFCIEYSSKHPSLFVNQSSFLTEYSINKIMDECKNFLELDNCNSLCFSNFVDHQLIRQRSTEKTGNDLADDLYDFLIENCGDRK
jgi:hypothetical protein